MARHGRDRRRGLDGGLTKEVQEELGFLAVSFEQCLVDRVGLVRSRIRAYRFAALSRLSEHSRGDEESPGKLRW